MVSLQLPPRYPLSSDAMVGSEPRSRSEQGGASQTLTERRAAWQEPNQMFPFDIPGSRIELPQHQCLRPIPPIVIRISFREAERAEVNEIESAVFQISFFCARLTACDRKQMIDF
jgi:hypothetical protein